MQIERHKAKICQAKLNNQSARQSSETQRNAEKTSEILTTTATAAELENVTITIQMEIAGEKSNSRQKKKSNQREITIPVMPTKTGEKFKEKFQNAKQSLSKISYNLYILVRLKYIFSTN